jgi:hypothetical protein
MTTTDTRWAVMALVISTGPIMVLCHGLLGTGSAFTGIFIASSIGTLLVLGWRQGIRFNACDALFSLFVCCILISSIANGKTDEAKEFVLFALSLAAYPAGRMFSGGIIRPIFLWITAIVVFLGAVVTLYALFQHMTPYGKAWVFGHFEAAPAQFLTSTGFLLFGIMASRLDAAKAIAIIGLVLPAAGVFAATIVRFTFVAIGASLLTALVISPTKERKYVALIIGVIVCAIVVGFSARPQTAIKYVGYAAVLLPQPLQEWIGVPPAAATPLPSAKIGCPPPETNNTVAIRQQLLGEAFRLVPEAGPFGFGLGGFKAKSCVDGTEVHNTIVQSFVEFGWLGGICFALLIILAAAGLPWRLPTPEGRFVIYGVVFTIVASFAHGNLSTDALLFLFLGYASQIRKTSYPSLEAAK